MFCGDVNKEKKNLADISKTESTRRRKSFAVAASGRRTAGGKKKPTALTKKKPQIFTTACKFTLKVRQFPTREGGEAPREDPLGFWIGFWTVPPAWLLKSCSFQPC